MKRTGNCELYPHIRQNELLLLTNRAWEFKEVLPGHFERNRPNWIGYKLPIIAPLPDAGAATKPQVGANKKGPFIYGICDENGQVLYIGKSRETWVTGRWIRPDRHSKKHYWAHGTTGKPNPAKPKSIERIAAHILSGRGNVSLMFADSTSLINAVLSRAEKLDGNAEALRRLSANEINNQIEALLIDEWNPSWNTNKPRASELIRTYGHYWIDTK